MREEYTPDLEEKIQAAEKKILDAENAGTLLILTEGTIKPNNYLTLLVTEGNVQVATNGETIENNLKNSRLNELKAMNKEEVKGDRPDIETVQAFEADDVTADFSQIKVSEKGNVIALEGSVFNAAAFKVAKGGKTYETAYNITVLGGDKTVKLAKIQFTLEGEKVIAKVVKFVK